MRTLALALLLALPSLGVARNVTITPANPVALEFLQVALDLFSCERVRFQTFQVGEGNRSEIVLLITRDQFAPACNQVVRVPFTLGAFPPGAYRLRTVTDADPPFIDAGVEFLVRSGPVSPAPNDMLPQTDLSGIWTATTEPFTGFAFIDSGGVSAQGRANRVTGLWYDYTDTNATWTELLLDSPGTPNNYAGQIVRAVPTGTGPGRTIALNPVGNATLSRIGDTDTWRIAGTVDGRAFDLTLERFRYTRAAWPGMGLPWGSAGSPAD